jgi:ketosteroid isomerase-like protein
MSQENVRRKKIARNVYQALNRRDWDTAFRDMHPDFELTTQLGPNSGTRRGRERVTEFVEDYLATFDAFIWEPEKVLRRRRSVVAFVRTRALPRGGSVDLVVRNGWWWTIRDGVILSVKSFPEPDRALEAAGLSEQEHARRKDLTLAPSAPCSSGGGGIRTLEGPNGP